MREGGCVSIVPVSLGAHVLGGGASLLYVIQDHTAGSPFPGTVMCPCTPQGFHVCYEDKNQSNQVQKQVRSCFLFSSIFIQPWVWRGRCIHWSELFSQIIWYWLTNCSQSQLYLPDGCLCVWALLLKISKVEQGSQKVGGGISIISWIVWSTNSGWRIYMGERRKRGVWDLIFPVPKEMDENVSIAPGMLITLSPWDFLR